MHVLAALGAAAILVGSVLALRQARLKLLVAYSTVAQIGYLFLMFPLVGPTPIGSSAWTGGILQAVSHALAKAAMFLAAGLDREGARTRPHRRTAPASAARCPMTLFAFGARRALADGAAAVRRLRREVAAAARGDRRAASGGGRSSSSRAACSPAATSTACSRRRSTASGAAPVLRAPVSRSREAVVLALALLSVAIGLLPLASFGLLQIGRTP